MTQHPASPQPPQTPQPTQAPKRPQEPQPPQPPYRSVLAVITGASRGIGAGVAAEAARRGATVATVSRHPTGSRYHLNADLADPASFPRFRQWYNELVDHQQPAEIVFVHNAAVIEPIGLAGSVDHDLYTRNVLLNSAAPQILGAAAIETALRTSTPSTVLQLSSGASTSCYVGWSSYCAAKAAVDMWVRTVGKESSHDPRYQELVRVGAFSPGVVATDMQAAIRAADQDGFPDRETFERMHHDGRLAAPDEVGVIVWATARSAAWESGSVIPITEGREIYDLERSKP